MDNRSKKALLVIDVQENLVNPASRMHINTDEIETFFSNLNHCIDTFHRSGHPVIYISNEWTNPFINWITGNVCKAGAPGTSLDPRVKKVSGKAYKKSKNNAFTNPGLTAYLKEAQIGEIYLAGLFAEHCILDTVAAAVKNDFRVVVVRDALGAKNNKNLQRSIRQYLAKGAVIKQAGELGITLSSN